MTTAALSSFPDFSVFSEWYSVRDDLAPFVGDRAIALFAHAISDAYGGTTSTAYLRDRLVAAGEDLDDPQLTEAESLLLRWGRLIASTPTAIDAEVEDRVAETFSAALRSRLVSFAALTIATNLYNTVGRERLG